MKNLFYTLLAVIGLFGSCAKTYTDKTANVQGQTFAILPFDVRIEKNINSNKTTQAQLDEMAKSEAYRYQSSTYNYILSKQKDFVVDFQDPDETNALLKRSGVTYAKLSDFTKSELVKILKVDGIMSGKMYRKERMSQELGKAIDIFSSQAKLGISPMRTNDANLSLSLFSKPEQRIVWTYQHNMSGTSDYAPEDITASLMGEAARKFPYRRKR